MLSRHYILDLYRVEFLRLYFCVDYLEMIWRLHTRSLSDSVGLRRAEVPM
jgi:hypothetical protein